MTYERRFFELRAEADARRLTGTAIKYGDVANIGATLRERFEPMALSIHSRGVGLNVQHDRGRTVARFPDGGLEITNTPEGVSIAATLPETREADDLLANIRARVITGFSIEFRARVDRIEGGNLRVVESGVLLGLAAVDMPSYPESLIEARSWGAILDGAQHHEPPCDVPLWMLS